MLLMALLGRRRKFRSAIVLTCLAVWSCAHSNGVLRSDEPRATPRVAVAPIVVETWSCAGDAEIFTYFVRLALTVRNGSDQPVVVPVVNHDASKVMVADNDRALADGKYTWVLEPDRILTGQRTLWKKDFVVVRPSEQRKLPVVLEFVLSGLMPNANTHEALTPGVHWVVFEWNPWPPFGDAATRRWRRAFEKEGQLLIAPIRSEPIQIAIPYRPSLRECRR
jgi:hypothetical protein